MFKRAFDLVFALALLPFVIPVLAIAGLAVRLDSPGPAFFRQARVGKDGRIFTMIKLRTMAADTEQRASHEVSAARITRLGAKMRRYKIDELPQVFSVIVGDMSFVGPRPCLPVQHELIEARRGHGALSVRPGITGPAQVRGVDMSTPLELAVIDGAYAADHSLAQDMRLILETALGKGSGDAVG